MIKYFFNTFAMFMLSFSVCGASVNQYMAVDITDNGNLLFYNNPPAIQVNEEYYVGYITNSGYVEIVQFDKSGYIDKYLVHDYKSVINYDIGSQDDHAAPALIQNENKIIVATSYHGSDLFVYEFDLKSKAVLKIKELEGRYTYPQLFMENEIVYLFAREQKTNRSGDLVYFTSKDFYDEKIDFLKSSEDYVVYNGSLAIEYPFVYTHYSKHSYEEKRLVGYEVVKYDLDSREIINSCDLEMYLDKDYFSNRPTGIGYNRNYLMLATAWFNPPVTYEKAESKIFSQINKVLILSGSIDACEFKAVHESESLMPYYDTNVSIFGDKFLYFQDGNKVVSNIKGLESCHIKDKSIYPFLLNNNDFVYASVLGKYNIRDFSTNVSACIKDNSNKN